MAASPDTRRRRARYVSSLLFFFFFPPLLISVIRTSSSACDTLSKQLAEKFESSLKCGFLSETPSDTPPAGAEAGPEAPRRIWCALDHAGQFTTFKKKGTKLDKTIKLQELTNLRLLAPVVFEKEKSAGSGRRPNSIHLGVSSGKSKKRSVDLSSGVLQKKSLCLYPIELDDPAGRHTLLAMDNVERQAWLSAFNPFIHPDVLGCKNGWLITKKADDEQMKRCYVVLDAISSALRLYPNKLASEQSPGHFSSEFVIDRNTVADVHDVDSCFELHLSGPAGQLYLQSISPDDRNSWLSKISFLRSQHKALHALPFYHSASRSPLSLSSPSPPESIPSSSGQPASPPGAPSSGEPTSPCSSSSSDAPCSSTNASSSSAITISSDHGVLDYSKITFGNRLSGGTFGEVWKGTYEGQVVAIKVLKDLDDNSLRGFRAELEVMAMFDSPYIIKSFGGCVEPKPCLVLEFASGGSLPAWLKKPDLPFGWKDMSIFALDIARGLHALHTADPQILHRDLKSLNILVQETPGMIFFFFYFIVRKIIHSSSLFLFLVCLDKMDLCVNFVISGLLGLTRKPTTTLSSHFEGHTSTSLPKCLGKLPMYRLPISIRLGSSCTSL